MLLRATTTTHAIQSNQFSREFTRARETRTHPYLQSKNVQSHGLRTDSDGNLLIPVQDSQDRFHGIQTITADGDKKFSYGSDITGHFFVLGSFKRPLHMEKSFICEGYATAATIYETHGEAYPVVVAFNAGNLKPVAHAIREMHPAAQIIICADNDAKPGGDNPGVTSAILAARGVEAFVDIPKFGYSESGTDFNDLNNHRPILHDFFLPEGEQFALVDTDGRHIHTILNQQYIDSSVIQTGAVNIIRSPLGTGKTFGLKKLVLDIQKNGGRVLYVALTRTLVSDAAKTLDLTHYEDIPKQRWRSIVAGLDGLAICLKSLYKVRGENFDLVIVDEIEQDLHQLTGNFYQTAEKQAVWEAMRGLIYRADTVIAPDGTCTGASVHFLQRSRPSGERFRIIENQYRPGEGQEFFRHASEEAAIDYALLLLASGLKVAIPTSGQGKDIHRKITAAGFKAEHFHGDTDDGHKQNIMRDINAYLSENNIRCLIYSPSLSTGVSIDSHFDAVVGILKPGSITPSGCFQMMHRARGSIHRSAYIGKRKGKAEISPAELVRGEMTAEKINLQLCGVHPDGARYIRSEDYLDLWARMIAASNAENEDFEASIIGWLEGYGYTMSDVVSVDSGSKITLKECRREIKQDEQKLIADAPHEESPGGATKAKIAVFYSIHFEDVDIEAVQAYRDGRTASEYRVAKSLCADIETVKAAAIVELNKQNFQPHVEMPLLKRELLLSFYALIGVVVEGGQIKTDGRRWTSGEMLAGMRGFIRNNGRKMLGCNGITNPPKHIKKKDVLQLIGSMLAVAGIKTKRHRGGYSVNQESVKTLNAWIADNRMDRALQEENNVAPLGLMLYKNTP